MDMDMAMDMVLSCFATSRDSPTLAFLAAFGRAFLCPHLSIMLWRGQPSLAAPKPASSYVS